MKFPFLTRLQEWRHQKKLTMLQLFLLIVGVVSLFYIFINFFTSLNEDHNPPFTKEKVSVTDMDSFMALLGNTVDMPPAETTSIKTLTNGKQFLPDVLSEISQAKSHIYISNYLWEDGEFSDAIFAALTEKARKGVRVRVLLDGVGGHNVSDETREKLEEAGGVVATFRPIRWWNINRWDNRNHMRNIVIDGKVGYIGGIAFTDAWMGDATTTTSWHDYMFKVDDGFAVKLESIFANLWSQTTGEILPASPHSVVPETKDSHFILLFSNPTPDTSSDMEHFMWLSIEGATKSIYIENPYILPSKSLKNALIKKAQEGVDVRIISPYYTDARHVRWASQSYYSELLGAGVKIYEYKKSRIHAKTMLVDGTWSVIGSANFDNRSSRINLEVIAGTDDRTLAKSLTEHWQEDVKESTEITKEMWKTHSILLTPVRLLSRLFVRQY